jgi:hypothetical protein
MSVYTGRKRFRDGATQWNSPAEAKRRYTSMNRGVNQRQMVQSVPRYRLYVPRTPGGQIVAERKYFDTTKNTTTISHVANSWQGTLQNGTQVRPAVPGPGNTTVNINCLVAPLQGNDISNREGRSIFVHNITVRGVITFNPGVESAGELRLGNRVRLIMLIDKQTNGSFFDPIELIESGNIAQSVLDKYQNTANFGRFQILKDKTFVFSNPAITHVDGNGSNVFSVGIRNFKFRVVFKNPLKINFNGSNSGTVSDIVDNAIHICAGAENTIPSCSIRYQSRASFSG